MEGILIYPTGMISLNKYEDTSLSFESIFQNIAYGLSSSSRSGEKQLDHKPCSSSTKSFELVSE